MINYRDKCCQMLSSECIGINLFPYAITKGAYYINTSMKYYLYIAKPQIGSIFLAKPLSNQVLPDGSRE